MFESESSEKIKISFLFQDQNEYVQKCLSQNILESPTPLKSNGCLKNMKRSNCFLTYNFILPCSKQQLQENKNPEIPTPELGSPYNQLKGLLKQDKFTLPKVTGRSGWARGDLTILLENLDNFAEFWQK